MSNYLITGGCGLIGSHLTEQLLSMGHRVRILDNLSSGTAEHISSECEFIEGDVKDERLVNKAFDGINGCFHLAAEKSEFGDFRVGDLKLENQAGMINILNAAHAVSPSKKVPVVYASSSAVYGDNASIALKEDALTRPLTAEAVDKTRTELHARIASLVHKTPIVGLRLFNVYGPYRGHRKQGTEDVVTEFIRRALVGLPIVINGGNGEMLDLVYVSDVCKFFIAAMSRASNQSVVYNVCSGKQVNTMELASTIFSVCGMSTGIKVEQAPKGNIRTSIGDPEKAIRHLQIRASTTLAAGIQQVIECLSYEDASAKGLNIECSVNPLMSTLGS